MCTPHSAPRPPGGGAGLGWTLLGTGFARYSVGLAYDAAAGYVLGFGFGFSDNETWRYLNGSWLNITETIPVSPTGRWGFGFAYDAATSSVVMFGGARPHATAALRETWEFSGGTWTNATNLTGPTPAAAVFPAMAYDAADREIVEYGGVPTSTSNLWGNQTGTWSSSGWGAMSVCCKFPALSGPLMAYDPLDGYVLMVGGGDRTSPFGVFSFVGGLWTNRSAGASALGPGRVFAAEAWSPSPKAVLLFGGEYLAPGGQLLVRNDTWAYSGGNWTRYAVGQFPTGRALAAAATDLADQCVVLTGGLTPVNATFSDTWTWNGSWNPLPLPPEPGGRDGSSLVYDGHDGYVFLFGGGGLNETWHYSLGSWIQLFPSRAPSPREMASMAYDASDGEVVLFGGMAPVNGGTSFATLNDTWTFVNGQWANITGVAGGPAARRSPAMTYDSTLGEVVLFGGVSATTGRPVSETWTFSANRWVNRTSSSGPPPSPRYSSAFADDPADRYAVLFGGATGTGTVLSDTWTYGNGSWSRITPTATPPPRDSAGLTYFASIGLVVLFGGATTACSPRYPSCPGPSLNDTWFYSAGRWANESPLISGSAWPRADPGVVDDRVDGYLVLFGGIPRFDDYWQFLPLTYGPLTARIPTVTTNPVTAGNAIVVSENATGGTPQYTYLWSGLPVGCAPLDQPSIACVPTSVGVATIRVLVNDSFNASSTSPPLALDVVAPNPLASVTTSLPQIVLAPGGYAAETAVAVGTNGSALESGVSFAWSVVGPVGALNATAGSTVGMTAGGFSAVGELSVRAVEGRAMAQANVSVLVETGPLAVLSVDVAPAVPTVREQVTLAVHVAGGVAPYSYTYAGLPAGCVSENASTLSCSPSSAGNYAVVVRVSDSAGNGANLTVVLSVQRTPGSVSPWVWVGLIAGGLATTAGAYLVLRRRRAPPSGVTESKESGPVGDDSHES